MFTTAKPIFLKNLDKEDSVTAFFAANFDCDGDNAILTIAGHSAYRVTINGDFVCLGPSKAICGFAKFDTVDISKYVSFGLNQIVIECASYEENKTVNFIQAEIFTDGKIVAATGYNFIGFLDVERLKAKGYSEKYNISGSSMIQTQVEVVNNTPILIKRDVPYPEYKIIKSKLKKPIDISETYEIEFENTICGFLNLEYSTDKVVEFKIYDENEQCIIDFKSIDGEFARESFNPYKVKKLKIVVSSGALTLNNIYIKEYSYYNGKTPKNTTDLSDNEFYNSYKDFIADYNDYRFAEVSYDETLADFQKKEKLYTKANKITESLLNIPTYSPSITIKNTLYKEILEETLKDNPDIKSIKYKRILNSL